MQNLIRQYRVTAIAVSCLGVFLSLGEGRLAAQQSSVLSVEHAECSFLGAKREVFMRSALRSLGVVRESPVVSATREVSRMMATRQVNAAPKSFSVEPKPDSLDFYILTALRERGVAPAEKTDDYTFIRRVTLDLTGRIPDADRVATFVADGSADKRAKLIEELMSKPEWVDKWTMYFGDLYQNNASNQQVRRFNEGRNAFYKYIHDSLAANKPYNQMANEIISAQGTNSFDPSNGQLNWLIGGRISNGPVQDSFDQQAANVAEEFLGMTHVNCLMCHNGAGHLDALNLWGSTATRVQAWQLSSFFSRTAMKNVTIIDPANPDNKNNYYWTLDKYTTDYQLNTTTGNRPARNAIGSVKTITPVYPFTGEKPASGQDYRVSLGQFVTKDFQFARATVNYMWAYFFGIGLVDPPDQFDLARLDAANPPPAPWTLQPSNPGLLDAMAHHFVNSGYDLKALMREITSSETYQLSSEYNGTWQASYEPLYARKYVRRLWAEEIHDAVVAATGLLPTYTVSGFSKDSTLYGVTSPGFGTISWAMQAPDVVGMPDNGSVSAFMDPFLRGDRDSNPRKGEGSVLQALNLMNDSFVETRVKQTAKGGIVARSFGLPDYQLVDTLYMSALSRHPTDDERAAAIARLSSSGNRTQAAEDLMWALFNKVDFVFNY